MTIERINVPDPISKFKKTENISKPSKTREKDSVELSSESKLKAEVLQATDIAKSSPSVRAERIEEVKKKLEDPSYINDRVVDAVAEKIMNLFDI